MFPTVNSSGSEFFEQANIKTGSEVLFHFIILQIYKQTGRNPVSLSLQGAAETLLRFARRDEVTTRLAPLLTRGESFSKTSACEVWGEKFCTDISLTPPSRASWDLFRLATHEAPSLASFLTGTLNRISSRWPLFLPESRVAPGYKKVWRVP